MLGMMTDCSSGDWVVQAASQWLKLRRLIIPSVGEHGQQACQSCHEFDILEELSYTVDRNV